jgi:hypothetical protein
MIASLKLSLRNYMISLFLLAIGDLAELFNFFEPGLFIPKL